MPRFLRSLLICATACSLWGVGLAASSGSDTATAAAETAVTRAATTDSGLARTPPMGFNDWSAFNCDVSEQLIEQTADYFAPRA